MTAIVNDEEISLFVEFLQEGTCHGCQLDLRGGGGDEPYLGVEAVELGEGVVEGVEFWFDIEGVFRPADETHVYGVVAGTATATVRESLVGRLDWI
tara:strand:+ start:1095 stop:1382 length:288 start_codon:yes stop_codon:yes gene_type:complete